MANNESRVAQWIWIDLPERNRPNQYVEFRLPATIPALPKKTALRISVDTDFAAWVNGALVGCGQFTDFPQARTFSEIDITAHIKQGENTIEILVYYCGVDHFSYLPGNASLWCEIEADGRRIAYSDRNTLCRISPYYQSSDTSRIDLQRAYTFHYDATRPSDAPWRSASIVEEDAPPSPRPLPLLKLRDDASSAIIAQGQLHRSTDAGPSVAELMQRDFLSARRSWELFDGFPPISTTAMLPVRLSEEKIAPGANGFYLVFDLSRETCGFIELALDCGGTCLIDIAVGEHLDDLRVRAHVGERNFASRYRARRGKQHFVHYLDRYAGRYIQLHITQLQGTLELQTVRLIAAEYPVNFAGELNSSDNLTNQIWKTARRTLHLCMYEHYEDCPWREQGLYANDSRNQMLSSYYAFGGYDFARTSLDLLAKTTRADGYQELCAPMKFSITIPSFTLTWFLAMNDYLMYSGDVSFVGEQLPRIKQMLQSYQATLKDGLLPSPPGQRYWHMYDWAPGLDGTDDDDCTKFHILTQTRFDAPLNLYCILALQAAANIAHYIGDEPFAKKCLVDAEQMKATFDGAFWNSERSAYQTYLGSNVKPHFAELTQSLALLAGIATADRGRQLRSILMCDQNQMIPTTLSQSLYKFEAILMDESGGTWVRDRIVRDWSTMLFAGATTFWETLKGGWDFHHAASLCHGWSAIPVYFYGAYGLGVKPLAPGFAKFSTRPSLSIPEVNGTVPTPRGNIDVSFVSGRAITESHGWLETE